MKKLYLFLIPFVLFFIAAAAASSMTWHPANQKTLAWDPVNTLTDGTPIPVGDLIEYEVYINDPVTDPDKTSPVSVGVTPETSYTVSFTEEGGFYLGVKAIRKSASGEVLNESEIAWSDDPADVENSVTFGVRFYKPIKKAAGLRIH